MSFFYPDQAYPGNDPFQVARQMGLNPMQAMQMMQGGSGQMGGPQGVLGGGAGGGPDYDPNMIAEMIGQQYNPYQGYPTKQVSDQAWDVYGPTPEYLLPQIHNIQNPDAGGFDLDAFFAAQPGLRGPLAEAYTQAEGDPIELYNYLQSNEPTETKNRKGETVQRPGFQDRLRQEVGATEWADLAEQGNPDIIRAFNKGASPEELDEIALDQYMQGLEGVLAAGSPTTQRAMGEFDYTRQREGFRPAPGTGQEYPQFQGAGFGGGGGGGDALSGLAQSPQYGAPQVVREDEGGVWVRTPGASDFSGPGRRVAQQIRRGQYGGVSRGSRRQDANGGGQSRRRSGSGDYGSPSGFYRRASKLNPFNWF